MNKSVKREEIENLPETDEMKSGTRSTGNKHAERQDVLEEYYGLFLFRQLSIMEKILNSDSFLGWQVVL